MRHVLLAAVLLGGGLQVPSVSGQHVEMIPPATPAQPGREFVRPPAIPPPARATGPVDMAPPAGQVPLSLQAALDLAHEYNPTLRQAKAQVNGILGTAIQAGLYPNPRLAYSGDQIGIEGTPGEFQGAIFRQEIVTAGKLRLSREKYLQRAQAAEALAVAQQYRVCNDIRLHYFDANAHSRLLNIQRQLLKSAEDSALTSREQYNVGQSNRAGVLRSNIKLQRTRLELLTRENEYQQAYRNLLAIIGISAHNGPLTDELECSSPAIEYETALVNLLENSPHLVAARAKLRGDQITLERERVQPIPNLQLEGGIGYNFETRNTVGAAGLTVQVPLWDRNQGTIRQAQADLARQQAEVQRIELTLRRDLADTYQQYITALQHVVQYRDVILPDAREVYRSLLESYKQNRIAWPDVLAAQQDYFMAQAEYVDALVRWRKAEVLINGMLLRDGLMAAESPIPPGHIDATPKPR